MKAIKFLSIAFILLGIGFVACKKDAIYPSDPGKISVKMKDAPGDYLAVYVDVQQVRINYNGVSWLDLSTNAGIYDLLTLQNDITATLTNGAVVPAGTINQIRLVLGPNNSVMTADSIVHPLSVPSGSETGLKVNANTPVYPNLLTTIVLDFDADQSIVVHGNGTYSLKPVIRLDQVIQQ
ncbi:MAG: starch-binding domain-like protein [Bacteroidetes bacterium]|jgi:hypothetical protein|nr:starch-binding domain-like protein [Bacteroidota bacterium]